MTIMNWKRIHLNNAAANAPADVDIEFIGSSSSSESEDGESDWKRGDQWTVIS